jgi:hypothetical protein
MGLGKLTGVAKKATTAAAKATAIAKRKAIEAAKEKKAKALKENQKKPINELMSKQAPAAQAEAGMGTASKTRITSGERGKALAGAKREYKATLNKLDKDPNLSDEQMEIMMGKLKDLEKRYGAGVKPTTDMSIGGMATKNYVNPVKIVDNRKKR